MEILSRLSFSGKNKKKKDEPFKEVDDEYIKKQQLLEVNESSNGWTRRLKGSQERKDYNVNDSSIVFSISNILSAEECLDYVNKAECGEFKSVNWEYHEKYRKCERVVFQSFKLSQVLWDRIKHHLTRNDIEDVKPFGFDNQGVWIPFCVNPCIRFTKYGKDDHFSAHKDGGFVWNEEQRSVFTLMIYLNSNEKNESNENDNENKNEKENSDTDTNEYSDSTETNDKQDKEADTTKLKKKKKKKKQKGKQTKKNEKVEKPELLHLDKFKGGITKFYSTTENNVKMLTQEMIDKGTTTVITPNMGTAVIFNHDVWHEGCKIESGHKYILRTDIVFRRVEHKLSNDAVINDPLFHECEALYQKSIELQNKGDAKGSTLAYLDALTIQAKLSSIDKGKQEKLRTTRTKDGFGKEIDWVPKDLYSKIFGYLDWSETIECCQVSKAWNYLVKSQNVWKTLYYQTWPELAEYENNNNIKNNEPDILTPWYHLFKYRYIADTEFRVMCVTMSSDHVEFDLGFRSIIRHREWEWSQRPERFKDFWTHFLKWDKHLFFESNGPIPAVFTWVAGHYWHCRSGRENAEVGARCLTDTRWSSYTKKRWLLSDYGVFDEDCFRNLISYVFADGCRQWQEASTFRLLLTLPYWFDDIENANYVLHTVYNILQVPYLSIQSAAKMSLIGTINKDTGIVISMEPRCLAITCVVNGKEDWTSKVVLNKTRDKMEMEANASEKDKQSKSKEKSEETDENNDADKDKNTTENKTENTEKKSGLVTKSNKGKEESKSKNDTDNTDATDDPDDNDSSESSSSSSLEDNDEEEGKTEDYYMSNHWWSGKEQHRMIVKGGVFKPPNKQLSQKVKKELTKWNGKYYKIKHFMNPQLNGIVFRNSRAWKQRKEFQEKNFVNVEQFDNQLSQLFTPEMRDCVNKNDGWKSITNLIPTDTHLSMNNSDKNDQTNKNESNETSNKEKNEENDKNEKKSEESPVAIPVKNWKGLENPDWNTMDLLCNLYNVLINCKLTTQQEKKTNEKEKGNENNLDNSLEEAIDIVLIGPCRVDFEMIIKYFIEQLMEHDKNINSNFNVVCDDLSKHYSIVQKQVENEKPADWKPVELRWDIKDEELETVVRVPEMSNQRSGLLMGAIKYSQGVEAIINREFKSKCEKAPPDITRIVDNQLN